MTTVSQQLNELTKQRNTQSFIEQMRQRADFEQMRLITDNTFNIDRNRIDTIKDFLTIEYNAVQAIIDDLLDDSVSGV